MITFCICLSVLIVSYFTYGKYLNRVAGVRNTKDVPSKTMFDGVDFTPLPKWKTFFIQLLNIAGLGPIFGVILGAAYGPVAFLWITLGGIFFGSMHDFFTGYMSISHKGCNVHSIISKFLSHGTKQFVSYLSVFLLVIIVAVFMSQPAVLMTEAIGNPNGFLTGPAFTSMGGTYTWELLIFLSLILAYYIVATLLPIDKIIGRIYPIFGLLLLFMAVAMLYAIFFKGYGNNIPELTSLRNFIDNHEKYPIIPMLFTTISCGAISGFHATQSPLMARCMYNENQSHFVFFGSMISESIIALIWAAIAMSFWGGVEGLNEAIAQNNGSSAILVNIISHNTMPDFLAILVNFGVIACAITTGDTALRSSRIIIADFFGINQEKLSNRLYICIPTALVAVIIITLLPFQAMWSYCAWVNQVLACFTLWAITSWLHVIKKPIIISAIPALIMTYVCSSYIFVSPLLFGLGSRPLAYILGGIITLIVIILFIRRIKLNDKKYTNILLQKQQTR